MSIFRALLQYFELDRNLSSVGPGRRNFEGIRLSGNKKTLHPPGSHGSVRSRPKSESGETERLLPDWSLPNHLLSLQSHSNCSKEIENAEHPESTAPGFSHSQNLISSQISKRFSFGGFLLERK